MSRLNTGQWAEHTMNLGLSLGMSCVGDVFVGETTAEGRPLITWTQNACALHLHVTDSEAHPLDLRTRATLTNMGWRGPLATGGYYWETSLPWVPKLTVQMSAVVVRAQQTVLGVRTPDALRYRGFNLRLADQALRLPASTDDVAEATIIANHRERDWDWQMIAGSYSVGSLREGKTLGVLGAPPPRQNDAPSRLQPGEYTVDRVVTFSDPRPTIAVISHRPRNGVNPVRPVVAEPSDRPEDWAEQGTEEYYRTLLADSPPLSLIPRRQHDRATAALAAGRLRAFYLDVDRPTLASLLTPIDLDPDRLGKLRLPPLRASKPAPRR